MSEDHAPTKRGDVARDGASRVRPAHNAHIRVAGTIRIGPRYAMLEDDDGDVWRLRSEDELGAFGDQRVIIEARVNATDELIVLWVGPDAASDAG
jgi:hypothetical protein